MEVLLRNRTGRKSILYHLFLFLFFLFFFSDFCYAMIQFLSSFFKIMFNRMDCWDIFWDVRGIHHVLAATTDWVLRLFSFLLPTLPTPPPLSYSGSPSPSFFWRDGVLIERSIATSFRTSGILCYSYTFIWDLHSETMQSRDGPLICLRK